MADDASTRRDRSPASSPQKNGVPPAEPPEAVLSRVREALVGLRFGQITITVHDGQIVQIERTERVRVPVR